MELDEEELKATRRMHGVDKDEPAERLKKFIKELKIDKGIDFRITADSRVTLAEDIEDILENIEKLKYYYNSALNRESNMIYKEVIKEKKEKNTYKFSEPLISESELLYINNNFENIVNEFSKILINKKDLAVAQYIIQKQQKQIKKQNKIIDLMADFIDDNTRDCLLNILNIDKRCSNLGGLCKDCIKQYFKNKA